MNAKTVSLYLDHTAKIIATFINISGLRIKKIPRSIYIMFFLNPLDHKYEYLHIKKQDFMYQWSRHNYYQIPSNLGEWLRKKYLKCEKSTERQHKDRRETTAISHLRLMSLWPRWADNKDILCIKQIQSKIHIQINNQNCHKSYIGHLLYCQ